MGKISNRQVVEELKNGDRKGAVHLVDIYQARLLSEAVNVFHVPHLDSEEIVSDVLMAVIQRIQSFEFTTSDGDFHFWVMTIFRNRVRDFARHQALTEGVMVNFDEAAQENPDEHAAAELEVMRSILRQYEESLRTPDVEGSKSKGKLEKIAEALDSLETWERVLLRCRAFDVPYEDIAGYTGKTAKQLKVYHGRVKKKFVRILAQHYPELVNT